MTKMLAYSLLTLAAGAPRNIGGTRCSKHTHQRCKDDNRCVRNVNSSLRCFSYFSSQCHCTEPGSGAPCDKYHPEVCKNDSKCVQQASPSQPCRSAFDSQCHCSPAGAKYERISTRGTKCANIYDLDPSHKKLPFTSPSRCRIKCDDLGFYCFGYTTDARRSQCYLWTEPLHSELVQDDYSASGLDGCYRRTSHFMDSDDEFEAAQKSRAGTKCATVYNTDPRHKFLPNIGSELQCRAECTKLGLSCHGFTHGSNSRCLLWLEKVSMKWYIQVDPGFYGCWGRKRKVITSNSGSAASIHPKGREMSSAAKVVIVSILFLGLVYFCVRISLFMKMMS